MYKRVAEILFERAVEDSANYAEQNMKDAMIFFDHSSKLKMFHYAVKQIKIDGLVGEFGVWHGKSIDTLAMLLPNKKIYGFDSFTGFKEDWTGHEYGIGDFDMKGELPNLQQINIELVKGYFDESLPSWLETHEGPFSFINIDCDMYGPTKTVLDLLGPSRIVSGTMILFDEYFGYTSWRQHEYKAWQEYVEKHKIYYKYRAINHMQVLVEVL
jgi:hypothetical protein